MSSQYIFTMHKLTKRVPPEKLLFNELTLSFFPGAKIGVLGYNGAGKSSLLKIMAGLDEDYRGEAELAPNASVGMLQQEPQLDHDKTVKENVEDGVRETKALLDRFNELAANYSDETADEFAALQTKIDAADAWNLDTELEYAMDALRCPPADASVVDLSGGERRRVALCRLLLSAPDLLLLDEPTNHLDVEGVAWLATFLAARRGTLVVVTHDRWFLDRVATSVLVLPGDGRAVKLAGGSDNAIAFLNEEEAKRVAAARAASAPPPSAGAGAGGGAAKGAPAKKKLSFNEQKEADALPARIELAEAAVAELEAKLADPALYKERGAEVPGLNAELEVAKVEVAAAYARWEQLEERR